MKVNLYICELPIRQTDTKPSQFNLKLNVTGKKHEINAVWEQVLKIPAFVKNNKKRRC